LSHFVSNWRSKRLRFGFVINFFLALAFQRYIAWIFLSSNNTSYDIYNCTFSLILSERTCPEALFTYILLRTFFFCFSLSFLEAGLGIRFHSSSSAPRSGIRNTRQNARKVSNFPRSTSFLFLLWFAREFSRRSASISRSSGASTKNSGRKSVPIENWSRSQSRRIQVRRNTDRCTVRKLLTFPEVINDRRMRPVSMLRCR